MRAYRLPDEAHIGHVVLQVKDLERALGFYADLLGFRRVGGENGTAILSASGGRPYHLLLSERSDAKPKPPHTVGLYHVAIRLPDRWGLARVFRRLLDHDWPFRGSSDHKVSEALYLSDPDGNGLELYSDRPRELWPRQDDQIVMTTDPLDTENLLAEVADDESWWDGIHPETDIGHIHLHASDLGRAEEFYHGLLGLDVTQRDYPGALFLSAGGYHHHLGLNVWAGAGAPAPSPDAVGLLSFALNLPREEAWQQLKGRVQVSEDKAPLGWEGREHSFLVRDPDGNGVEILLERSTLDSEE